MPTNIIRYTRYFFLLTSLLATPYPSWAACAENDTDNVESHGGNLLTANPNATLSSDYYDLLELLELLQLSWDECERYKEHIGVSDCSGLTKRGNLLKESHAKLYREVIACCCKGTPLYRRNVIIKEMLEKRISAIMYSQEMLLKRFGEIANLYMGESKDYKPPYNCFIGPYPEGKLFEEMLENMDYREGSDTSSDDAAQRKAKHVKACNAHRQNIVGIHRMRDLLIGKLLEKTSLHKLDKQTRKLLEASPSLVRFLDDLYDGKERGSTIDEGGVMQKSYQCSTFLKNMMRYKICLFGGGCI